MRGEAYFGSRVGGEPIGLFRRRRLKITKYQVLRASDLMGGHEKCRRIYGGEMCVEVIPMALGCCLLVPRGASLQNVSVEVVANRIGRCGWMF